MYHSTLHRPSAKILSQNQIVVLFHDVSTIWIELNAFCKLQVKLLTTTVFFLTYIAQGKFYGYKFCTHTCFTTNHDCNQDCLWVNLDQVYAQPVTDLLTLGRRLNDRPPTVDDLMSSQIDLWQTTVGSVGVGIELLPSDHCQIEDQNHHIRPRFEQKLHLIVGSK